MNATTWREWVADPRFLVICRCGHAEQHHRPGCKVVDCICDTLTVVRSEWVGSEPD